MEKQIILFSLLGAIIPDVLRIIKARHDPQLPAHLKSPSFYVGLALLMGIAIAAVYLSEAKTTKEALAIGFSAPEIVSRLLGSHKVDPGVMDAARRGMGDTARKPMRGWWGI